MEQGQVTGHRCQMSGFEFQVSSFKSDSLLAGCFVVGEWMGSCLFVSVFPMQALFSGEFDQDNFWTCAHSQWRSPGACAGRRVHLHLSVVVEAFGELAKNFPSEPGERKHLAAVGVTGELE